MGIADPIATDILLSLPATVDAPEANSIVSVESGSEPTVRLIVAFNRQIRGMPNSTSIMFGQCIGAPPVIPSDTDKFASKRDALATRQFVHELCMIDGIVSGCLMNGSLILEIVHGVGASTTIKRTYELLEQRAQLFASDPQPECKQSLTTS